MKPVVVIRHAKTEGAGFFGAFLDQHNIPWQMTCIDKGDAIPQDVSAFSGLVMMGGPMSVNDDLPWIEDEVALIKQAMGKNLPVLGHCLGGQLISKALGATVKANPVKEIGWGEVHGSDEKALSLFGVPSFESFHWHGETFELPKGAKHMLASQHCQNQAYLIGNAIAFQCHIEMTEEMVKTWSENGSEELESSSSSPAVQQAELIQQNLERRVANLNVVATNVYTYWTGLLHSS
ncbi:MAG: type 1 glutamine amidotransferase [Candidatus Methylopumilus sp.]|nr:type 1 glutamine amidotransferase [Candidatus Methylopumilus sp.]